LTKLEHIHSWDTLRTPLNIDYRINNERQTKIGTVSWMLVGWTRVNEGEDGGMGSGSIGFVYIIEQWNTL
jgi:hypothetical protein